MPTIKEVALLAGVSTATVSRAMMNPQQVAEKTRRKVEAAIAEVGYSPNAIARNLRTSESKTIVVIIPDIENMFFAKIVRGIQTIAQQQGYKVLLGDTVHNATLANDYLELVRSKQADGVISLTAELPKVLQHGTSMPMVMACEYFPDFPIPTVRIDNQAAAYQAVKYLLELGHKQIAYISGPLDNPICIARSAGYRQAMQEAGYSINELAKEEGDFSFHSGHAAFERLHRQYKMSALFCFNDMMALGAMRSAISLGLKVPDDLSIVGMDDLLFSQYTDPQLTTIMQPQTLIGETAMQILIKILNAKTVHQDNVLQTQLLVRSSSRRYQKL
ncbi:LacI family transcriptional regulator [Alginatibacterium sediminis]|uniref:LacI family transcriptional regulator n=1 Tax=Alginatibacterium sediminis TaxID=2164068 RepID=A0A420ECY0_9ALTE|nr:LacI family DNA-binding transcriptional regulator [Alginatibacterium sediminis]RKF18482.1 LacI family transcriptional regulator [Alginatibacterium sediminis]